MFTRLGRVVVRRRRLILALTALFVAAAAVIGTQVFERLGRRGFDDPGSESSGARQYLEDEIGAGDPDVVLLVDAVDRNVDDPAVVAAGTELTSAVAAEEFVASAVSYWSLGQAAPLRDAAGTAALVLIDLDGTDRAIADAATAITEEYAGPRGPVEVGVGGREAVASAITEQVETDLARAEAIAVPATLALLVLVFGGLLAAALPMAVALVALIGTFLALFLIALATDVSIFAINLTASLGLGLAIDYSLFIVNRFREELRAGQPSDQAIVHTMETAGRTVAFSALIPPLPHQGGTRPNGRQHRGCRGRARANGPDRHGRRRRTRRHLPLRRHQRRELHQDVRARHGSRRRDGCNHHPGAARPRLHAPRGRSELVGTATTQTAARLCGNRRT